MTNKDISSIILDIKIQETCTKQNICYFITNKQDISSIILDIKLQEIL